MKFKNIFLILIFLQISIVSCQGETSPVPLTPTPPSHFLDLPTNAKIICPAEGTLRRGSIALWPHTARPPLDDSSKIPNRGGDSIGLVDDCTPITVVGYEWSEFEQNFWLHIYISNDNQGWLSSDYVDFEH